MKNSKIAIAAIIAIALLMQTCIPTESQSPAKLTITRLIDVQQSYTLIIDEVTVAQGSLSNLTIYLPIQYENNTYAIRAVDWEGEELEVKVQSTANYMQLNVELPQKPAPLKVKIEIYMINLLAQAEHDLVKLTIPLYPTLPIEVESCYVEVLLPQWTKRVESVNPSANATLLNGRYSVNYTKAPLPAMMEEQLEVTFSATLHQVQCLNLTREVKVNGELDILDAIKFKNAGFTSIPKAYGVNFTLPKDATIISVKDDFGDLKFKVHEAGEEKIVNVKLRINLESGWKYEVYIHYKLPSSGWIKEEANKELLVPMDPFYKFPADQLKVIIDLPPGSELKATHGMEPASANGKVIYVARKVIGGSYPHNVKVEYTPPPLRIEIPTSVLAGTLIGALIGAAVYFKRYVFKKPKPPVEAAPTYLEDLYGAYMDKLEILIDMKNLEEAYRAKRIVKRAYRARMRELREELKQVDSKISQLKAKALAENAKLQSIIKELEEAEAEYSAAMMKLRELERNYASKKITRREYEEARRTLEKDARKARMKLERKLADLLELAS
ncbi:MAG: hypothetical protein NDF55_03060 [archaeon GB-1867-005]|nr:hypothetical protein [Candidatus Culexmicrobium cathedralense]